MTIDVGSRIPAVDVFTMGEDGPRRISTADVFAGKRVVIFGVPGAFTPGCTRTHLPGFVVHADTIKARGIDEIVCMSVNDAHVMDAWGKAQNAEHIFMLADGNADLARAMGLDMDGRADGRGTRCRRFAAIVDDGRVTWFAMETQKGVHVTGAEQVLEQLPA